MKTNELLLASDHRGMELKDKINDWICPLDEEEGTKLNIAVMHDIGVYSDKKKVDYPDIANKFADEMSITSHGVIVCGSGFGVNIAVNRHKHIRAATCRTGKEVEEEGQAGFPLRPNVHSECTFLGASPLPHRNMQTLRR